MVNGRGIRNLMYLLAAISAFWLGVVTSISPCPMATNVAAISFIGRKLESPRQSIYYSLAYTLGRMLAYLIVGMIVVAGLLAIPAISEFLQKYMNQVMGIVLIIVGMFLLELIKIRPGKGIDGERLQKSVGNLGMAGGVALGFIFALSFCPVSAAWFFGSLIPLAVKHNSTILFPLFYGIGTALPVVIFGVIIASGARTLGKTFDNLKKIELIVRRVTGVIFILVGIYYCLIYIFGIQIIRGAI